MAPIREWEGQRGGVRGIRVGEPGYDRFDWSGDGHINGRLPEGTEMRAIDVYLTFDGNCREAMTFYQSCLGGRLVVPEVVAAIVEALPPGDDRVPHMRLECGDGNGASGFVGPVLLASDTMPGAPKNTLGNNFAVGLNCESREEMERVFARLSVGGKVTLEPGEMIWGARFGMLRDKFGVSWMVNWYMEQPVG